MNDTSTGDIVQRLLEEGREIIVGEWGLNCRYWEDPHGQNPRGWPSLVSKMETVYFAHYRTVHTETKSNGGGS